VKTIVRINPMRLARLAALRAEIPARYWLRKKWLPASRLNPEAEIKPVGHEALQDEPAGKSIQEKRPASLTTTFRDRWRPIQSFFGKRRRASGKRSRLTEGERREKRRPALLP